MNYSRTTGPNDCRDQYTCGQSSRANCQALAGRLGSGMETPFGSLLCWASELRIGAGFETRRMPPARRIEEILWSNGSEPALQNRFRHEGRLYNRPHARRQDHAQDARATHNRRANDGAREQCTGLRHRPEKGGEGETPGRRASRVASAPNSRTQAIAHTYYTGSPRRHTKKLPRRRRRVPPDVLRVTSGAPLRPRL